MKECILITSEYPFAKGENFIETEIQYLSDAFDAIYCFAVCPSDSISRLVPPNVYVYGLKGVKGKIRYPHYMLKGIFEKRKAFRINQKQIKKILASWYCRGRANSITNQIIGIIDSSKIQLNDVVVYSYWFTYHAIIACNIKDYLLQKGKKVKAVSRAHGYDVYWETNAFGYLPFQEEIAKILDGVYPCSNNGTKYLIEKYPAVKEKIRTALLGTIDHGLNSICSDSHPVFITCCSFKPLKRMPLFAEAFALVSKKLDVKWICIGDGDEADLIRAIIQENGIENCVQFTGFLANEDIIYIYKHNPITYFCNVSTTEGLPVSIMEAMSFGIPIIATDVGGTGELVDETVGKLLPADIDSGVLSTFLIEALDIGAKEYNNMRIASRRKWELMSNADTNYREWCNELTQSR